MTQNLPPRIFGIETEYGLSCLLRNGHQQALDADHAARMLFAPIVAEGRSTSMFLPNGGRLYLDVGSHPEYATAECNSLEDIINQDRAGVEMLRELVKKANRELDKQGIDGEIHLFKNNVDSQGNSCGCHENYLLHRDKMYTQLAESVISFLVTRQIITGAGWLKKTPDGQVTYAFSQRAYQTFDAVSSATTRTRPVINTRDEPHADAASYRRMHVVVGDSNILEAPTLFKIGSMNMLLACLEDGLDLSDLLLADPMRSIREVTDDMTATVRLEMARGGYRSALELQSELRERIGNHLANRQLDELEKKVFEIWDLTLTSLREKTPEKLNRILDWAAKWNLIQRYQERTGVDLSDPRVARLDLAYHEITTGGLNLDERGLAQRYTTPESVRSALDIPPQTTRAVLRGEVIRLAREKRRDLTVDWMHLRLDEGNRPTIMLKDPFATSDRDVEVMLEQIRG